MAVRTVCVGDGARRELCDGLYGDSVCLVLEVGFGGGLGSWGGAGWRRGVAG